MHPWPKHARGSLITGLLLASLLVSGCSGWLRASSTPGEQEAAEPPSVLASVPTPKSYYPDLLKPPVPDLGAAEAAFPPSPYPALHSPPAPDYEAPAGRWAYPKPGPPAPPAPGAYKTDGHLPETPAYAARPPERPRVHFLSNRSSRGELVQLNFDNADILSVIRAVAELAEINYIVHPNVQGTVTVQTAGKIPVKDLLPTLEQILAVNELALVKVGDLYRVVPASEAPKLPLAAQMGRLEGLVPEREEFIIQIIPVRYVPSSNMLEVVKPLLSPKAVSIPIRNTNNLMIVDMASNVKKVLRIVKLMDTSTFDRFHTKLYPLEHVDAETLSEELEKVFTALGYAAKPGGALEFIPISRLNAVLVVSGFPDLAPAIEMWTSQLDQPVRRGGEQTFVYYVQHGDAENIATILQSLFQEREETTAAQPGVEPEVEPGRRKIIPPKVEEKPASAQAAQVEEAAKKFLVATDTGEMALFVVPDKETNSLIFRTSPVNYQNVLALIKKLDRKPKQVIIEALVAEVTLSGDLEFGLEYALRQVDTSSGGTTSVGQLGTVLAAPATLPLATDAAAAATSGGLSLFVTNPNRFLGTLDALARENNLNVVSSPSILTSENKAAEINVVTEVPIPRTTTDPNTETTRTDFEFREVGVKLKVTPKINEERYVTLEIEEELSEIGARTEGEDAPPNFNSREAKTTVLLKDNQSLVIGGLISERVQETQTGIPFLNRIPILKHIFGSTSKERTKTELMVLLTPRLVVDESESRAITDLYNERLQNIQKLFKRNKVGLP